MAGQKQVVDSIAVKMKNFAKDVYTGMTTKTTEDVIKNLQRQGVKAEQIFGKNPEKVIEKSLNEAKGRTGYRVGNFIGGGIRDSIKDYNAAKAVYADNVAKGMGEKELAKFKPSIKTAIVNGHSVFDDAGKRVGYNKTAIAGTAVAGSLVGRVATGGGLYRDRYGNVNVPGVPFI